MILCNGEIIAQASQFSLKDVEVLTATVDLDTVVTYRASVMSRSAQSAECLGNDFVEVGSELTTRSGRPTPVIDKARIHSPEEEIALGPACYLWDYLRRTGLSGFFLPLSGGIDSSSTACIVASMCRLVHADCVNGDQQVCS
jgi:NAD+ synthase (glutamine-hydrolysing)